MATNEMIKERRYPKLTPHQLEVLLHGAEYKPIPRPTGRWISRNGMAWYTSRGRLCTDQVWALRRRGLISIIRGSNPLAFRHIFIPQTFKGKRT